MKITESFRSGFGSLFHNKLRSFLTMLGVIIGVTSVILLTSIGEGVKQQIGSQVESLGVNLVYVFPGKINFGNMGDRESQLGARRQRSGEHILNYEDVLSLKGQPGVAAVTGIFNGIVRLNELSLMVTATGVDEDFNTIRNLELEFGRFIELEERESKQRVAVIGDQTNKELFQGINSVGQTFKLNEKEYRVIGVLQYKKPESMGPQAEDINIKIYIPITEMIERFSDVNLSQIIIKANSAEKVDSVAELAEDIIRANHGADDFTVVKQQDMLDVFNNIMGVLSAALGGIAAISLIVGGIGIMNIMLVSVTERTREIGMRKAVGANRLDILSQFLIEAVTLSITGGLIGLLLGIFGSRLITEIFPSIPTAISVPAVMLSLIFTFFIGLFFGVYPSLRASRLDPIEALRSE